MDRATLAAFRFLLKGEGKSRSGTYVVTVHGGRVTAVAPIGSKLSSESLAAQQEDEEKPPLQKGYIKRET